MSKASSVVASVMQQSSTVITIISGVAGFQRS